MLPLCASALLFKTLADTIILLHIESGTTTTIKKPCALSPSFAFHTVYTGHDFTHVRLIADDSDESVPLSETGSAGWLLLGSHRMLLQPAPHYWRGG